MLNQLTKLTTMKKQKIKIPRKTKKELKKQIILAEKDWKEKEVKIISTQKNSRYRRLNPTFKGLTVTGYTLGCNK